MIRFKYYEQVRSTRKLAELLYELKVVKWETANTLYKKVLHNWDINYKASL